MKYMNDPPWEGKFNLLVCLQPAAVPHRSAWNSAIGSSALTMGVSAATP
eukprot:COSAG06_NODE_55683_length_288_cov_1.084656_1_plen_48_part_10